VKTLLKSILIAPFALILLGFALANRSPISITLDPFSLFDPPLNFTGPVFLPIFLSLILGVFLGGIAMWVSEGRHRRAAKIHLRDLERQRREMEELRREKTLPPLPPSTLIG
jgi:uncharacterized integral membrane protein